MTEVPPGSALAKFLDVIRSAGYHELTETSFEAQMDTKRSYVLDEEGTVLKDVLGDIEFYWSVSLLGGVGYYGFFCVFYFDREGSLLTHGAWE